MSNFGKTIDEIIYVLGLDEEELRRGVRAFNHTPYAHTLKQHMKEYLLEKGVKYGVIKDSTLSHIPLDHSSFHEDEDGNPFVHTH
jgi:hypothetical protein